VQTDHVERLRAVPLFTDLDEAALTRAASIATEVEFPRGALLMERNHPGSGLFVILDGTVQVELPQRTVELGPGEFVGELSLLTDRVTRSARVRAAGEVRCLAMSRRDFCGLVEAEPRIALSMLSALAQRLSARTAKEPPLSGDAGW
jgi:CRP-like cAMP-binding protein